MSLNKVSSQRILGVIKDSNLSFSPHIENIANKYKRLYNIENNIENIANKYKRLYNRLAIFPDIPPDVAIQIF